jgi:CMP-N,N'-diacetyllegionaminic acid synthase
MASLRPDKELTVLIPARAGSQRIPRKNVKLLGGKPLIEWTIEAAKAANVAQIIVSSDDPAIYPICRCHRVEMHFRKPEHATDTSPDIDWVLDVLPMVTTPYVAICRPTSPFRTASTIRRAFAQLVHSKADSVRAVTKIDHPHPAKMWMLDSSHYLVPVLNGYDLKGNPWHSMPTQSLPTVYQQNASLEMARVEAIVRTRTISGEKIEPFFTEQLEGFDINVESDFVEAERLALGVL